ncbi:MAG TPA: DUF4965 domain-containing protein [Chthonomonadales bacterium]|nr:DUF4965 domain-containing protein [Chthonomonadales bacterium]
MRSRVPRAAAVIAAELLLLCAAAIAQAPPVRPPAVPLIVRNPYVSVWQPANDLAGTWPRFWTGSIKAITGVARVDGEAYLFMGAPSNAPHSMQQVSLTVTPTQSIYLFRAGGVSLTVDFLSPIEPQDLRRLSVPFGDILATADSADGKTHRVELYFDISGEWAGGDSHAEITWRREPVASGGRHGLICFAVAPSAPKPLGEVNDYPTWGTAVFAAGADKNLTTQAGEDTIVRRRAFSGEALDNSIDPAMPRQIGDRWPVFAFLRDLGSVRPGRSQSMTLLLGLVRDPAVSYLGKPLPPLWKSYWPNWQRMLAFVYRDARGALQRARSLDSKIVHDAERAGGPHYAALCALAFRQAFGATELVGGSNRPWMFMKEISSDGNISTIDVVYPAFPVFLYSNPQLLRLQLEPLLAYAETGGWPKPFAEHDIGSSYPNANGHNDGREEDMPVEESANMLVMCAAYLRKAPPADAAAFAREHYRILKQWADYEAANGLDPAYQNQTDDFTGFIKSSANLALKAIVGVGAMGIVARSAGNEAESARYRSLAGTLIASWQKLAASKTGRHLTLAYGQDDTWSLKYNAFPDRALDLRLLPPALLDEEARWYAQQEKPFGIPLDNRHTYTKTDWELWTAAASNSASLRQYIIDSVYRFVETSRFRGAFTDWYDTVSGQQVGFVARPVIGGVFALLVR